MVAPDANRLKRVFRAREALREAILKEMEAWKRLWEQEGYVGGLGVGSLGKAAPAGC